MIKKFEEYNKVNEHSDPYPKTVQDPPYKFMEELRKYIDAMALGQDVDYDEHWKHIQDAFYRSVNNK